MSETALTLIKSSLRSIGVLPPGETPSAEQSDDALEALRFMLQNWSATGLRVGYVTQEDLAFSSSPSTIGTGYTLDTVRPDQILDAYLDSSRLAIIDYAKYNRLVASDPGGTPSYLYYAREYPAGKIYVYPDSSGTLSLSSLKPLTEPTAITSTVAFAPEYNDAIKWNLALRLCPEYGREPSRLVLDFAMSTLRTLETKNFNDRIVQIRPEVISIDATYNIDEG